MFRVAFCIWYPQREARSLHRHHAPHCQGGGCDPRAQEEKRKRKKKNGKLKNVLLLFPAVTGANAMHTHDCPRGKVTVFLEGIQVGRRRKGNGGSPDDPPGRRTTLRVFLIACDQPSGIGFFFFVCVAVTFDTWGSRSDGSVKSLAKFLLTLSCCYCLSIDLPSCILCLIWLSVTTYP